MAASLFIYFCFFYINENGTTITLRFSGILQTKVRLIYCLVSFNYVHFHFAPLLCLLSLDNTLLVIFKKVLHVFIFKLFFFYFLIPFLTNSKQPSVWFVLICPVQDVTAQRREVKSDDTDEFATILNVL